MVYQQAGKPITNDMLNDAYDDLDAPEQGIIKTQVKRMDNSLKRLKMLEAQKLAEENDAKFRKPRGTGFGKLAGMEVLAKLGIFLNELEERDPEAFGNLKNR